MSANKPTKSFKKLTLAKDTVQPMPSPAVPSLEAAGRSVGALSSSDYCSGGGACSIFYPC
jgi:hypothetical protein